ncbi:MAG TPA: DUF4931 domain-containing protein [Candidatus Binatia bacterium]|jgi:UDPglucose--hexose-1-phosphate uridylyltransferase|nr:DUF4931 domain-containing protein [Candidatus Binatia bacterium]
MRKTPKSEIRKDYLQDKYVIIAPRRSRRPSSIICPACRDAAAPKDCAFCPEHADKARSLMDLGSADGWHIKVLANKYPAVSKANPLAYGVQEVVIETPDHVLQFEELPVERIAEIMWAWAERTQAIAKDKRIKYVIVFKNTAQAGASILHSHSQIFATDFVPPHLADKARKALEYRHHNGVCPYCDIMKKEMKGPRRVYADEHVVAFTPYASMHNYELWILPRRHVHDVAALNADERLSWAKVLRTAAAFAVKKDLPYNFYFHQIVRGADLHLYMKLIPRGSVWAGVEIGSGVIINPVAPEDAAAQYRKAFSTR